MNKNLALLPLCVAGLSLTSCGVSCGVYADADKYLSGNQTYSENITSLDIDWISGSLTLIEDDNIEGVKIEEDTNVTKEKELVHTYLNEGILKIKFFASGHVSAPFFKLKKDLTVTYHPGIEVIKVDMTSGSFKANTLTADKVDIGMTSGFSNIGTITAQEVDTDFTSGSMTIEHVNATSFDSDITSGSLKVKFDEISKASFDMTSGSIDMTLPESGGKVKASKTSGRIITERECTVSNNLYTFGEGSADIKVSMTSGKITIR